MYNNTTIVFDLDGTICPIKNKDEDYLNLTPNKAIVKKMRFYASNGTKIIIYTSRNMRTYDCNIEKINTNTVPIIKKWLKKWDIPYNELIIGKPWAGEQGFYVDDRAIRPNEFLEKTLDELIDICKPMPKSN